MHINVHMCYIDRCRASVYRFHFFSCFSFPAVEVWMHLCSYCYFFLIEIVLYCEIVFVDILVKANKMKVEYIIHSLPPCVL